MVTSVKIPITSSELGTLWTTYERAKMMKVLIDHFYDKSENEESKKYCLILAKRPKNIFLK